MNVILLFATEFMMSL